MNCTAQNLVANAQNLATMPTPPAAASFEQPPKLGPLGSLRVHWPEYLMEAGLLGAFMVSACVFGALYEFPHSPVRQAITSQLFRRMLMGISMGLTAIAIIYSPWGKQSGAHINPSVTFTFFRLGKVKLWDAIFYIAAPFAGMSMNPARTFGSGFSAEVWNGLWIYLTAPPLGMLTAAEFYLWRKGRQAVKCCKLHHDNDKRCIFCGANGGFAS